MKWERNTLKNVCEKLADPAFVYVDKGKLINLRHVLALHDRKICLRNGGDFLRISEVGIAVLCGAFSFIGTCVIL